MTQVQKYEEFEVGGKVRLVKDFQNDPDNPDDVIPAGTEFTVIDIDVFRHTKNVYLEVEYHDVLIFYPNEVEPVK